MTLRSRVTGATSRPRPCSSYRCSDDGRSPPEKSLHVSEIKVLSSIATKEAYLELVPQFEKASGHTVSTTWSGTTAIMKRMAAGEQYDLVDDLQRPNWKN